MAESVTRTVNDEVPDAAGVPEIVPLDASVRPAGNVPVAIAHVYGGVPPVAARVAEYAAPTVPGGRVAVVTVGGPLMAIESDAVAVCPTPSVTRAVKLDVPGAVGVPEIVPVEDRLNPGGNVPLATAHVYGVVPPVAAKLAEYAVPTVPPGSEVVVIDTAGLIVMLNWRESVSLLASRTITRKL